MEHDYERCESLNFRWADVKGKVTSGPFVFRILLKEFHSRLFAPIKKMEKSLLVFAPYYKRDNYPVKGKT